LTLPPTNVLKICKIYTNFLVVKALLDVSAIVGQIQGDRDTKVTVLLNMPKKMPKYRGGLIRKDN